MSWNRNRQKSLVIVISMTLLPQFAFTAIASDPQAEINCVRTSLSRTIRVKSAEEATMPEEVIAKLKKTKKGVTIDGFPADLIQEVPKGHDRGIYHTGLYRVNVEGSSHIIKLIDDKNDSSMTYRMDHGMIDVDRIYRGMLWAQEAGGPHLYRAGRIQMPDGSTPYFYDMEELFPNKPSITYKGGGVIRDYVLAHPGLVRSIARLFVRAFELNLAPVGKWDYQSGLALPGREIGGDLDFMFSNNHAAWLDTDTWEVVTGAFDRRSMTGVYEVIVGLGKDDVGKDFKNAFIEEVKKSTVLSKSKKSQLLKLIKLPPVRPFEPLIF